MIEACKKCGRNIANATCEVHPEVLCTPKTNLAEDYGCNHTLPLIKNHKGKYWRDV